MTDSGDDRTAEVDASAEAEEPQDEDEYPDGDVEVLAPRLSRWNKVLGILLVAALAFTAGIWVHRLFVPGSATATAETTAGFARSAGAQSRASASGFPGQGGFGGQASPGANSAPVLTGTVAAVSGDTLTVTDAEGVAHRVVTTAATTLTEPISGTGLKTGQTVRVFGTRSDDGSVTAASITIR